MESQFKKTELGGSTHTRALASSGRGHLLRRLPTLFTLPCSWIKKLKQVGLFLVNSTKHNLKGDTTKTHHHG